MALDRERVRKYLKDFDFKPLFIEELLWDRFPSPPITINIDEKSFKLYPVAQKAGLAVFLCEEPESGKIPSRMDMVKIDTRVRKIVHEHLIIFIDNRKTEAVWLWIKREKGVGNAIRTHKYVKGHSGDSLIQKLEHIAWSLDEPSDITTATQRGKAAWDVEKVTKKFYTVFKSKHDEFLKFIKGIDDLDKQKWYTSVMLNRLMFIYFIQKKCFLNNDHDYLNTKLAESKSKGENIFYSKFLTMLFFDGFAKEEKERDKTTNQMLGKIPFLNGGIFMPHEIEQTYGISIKIPDEAFEELFAFFDQYRWNLDERPTRDDREINPDVLGYIFEKYINQKQMGAYYTKEDITDYISKNTIIPLLFSRQRPKDIEPFPMDEVEPYIYDAVKKGVELELPDYIECGIREVPKRTRWNEPADDEFALPTEIWREVVARRQRYRQIHDDFKAGKILNINDLITYNLDITRFAQDWVAKLEEPSALNYFYFENLKKISVLDPTCGSGAFLFAALNILESLYEIALDRMEEFLESRRKDRDTDCYIAFDNEIQRIGKHPNRKYFIYKSIIINNLFGVDIMDEAVEICKLRLFLKLAAQVDDVDKIEPLPDIDFNIRAGNTLIGYTSKDEIEKAKTEKFDFTGNVLDKVKEVDRVMRVFRDNQIKIGVKPSEISKAKDDVQRKLKEVTDVLDRDLASIDYGIDTSKKKEYEKWRKSHKPFHWYVEFYNIMDKGGFDVIIGNPPYLEKKEVDYEIKNYRCLDGGTIHSICMERTSELLSANGSMSLIVPMSLVSTQRMKIAQNIIEHNRIIWYSNYSWRPGKLFETVNRALTIYVACPSRNASYSYSTNYQRWSSETRNTLMQLIFYNEMPLHRPYYWVPKIGQGIELLLLNKVLNNSVLGKYIGNNDVKIFYRTTGGLYWKVFTDFSPLFKVNGKKGHSSRETWLCLKKKEFIYPAVAVLSSDIFWWWYTITSNLRDLNPSDIHNFPIGNIFEQDVDLINLGKKYISDLVKNSIIQIRHQKQTGKTETQLFKIQKSKPIIDEIDRVLAKHYGFTDEELDFIINYDIKYRMGKGSGEEESDDE